MINSDSISVFDIEKYSLNTNENENDKTNNKNYDINNIFNEFNEDGFNTILEIIPAFIIDKLYHLAMNNFDEVMNIIKTKNLTFGIGIKEGFKEITQRHLGRFEMPYKVNDENFYEVFKNNQILSIIKNILGDDAVIVNRSIVISLPDTSDQAWHTDGPHMVKINIYIYIIKLLLITNTFFLLNSQH